MKAIVVWMLLVRGVSGGDYVIQGLPDEAECRRLAVELHDDGWVTGGYDRTKCKSYTFVR